LIFIPGFAPKIPALVPAIQGKEIIPEQNASQDYGIQARKCKILQENAKPQQGQKQTHTMT
jgi:hypothetical protein